MPASYAADTIETIRVGVNPTDVGLNPVTKRLYVANYGGNSVWVLDSGTNAVIKTIERGIGERPLAVMVNPNKNKIFVTNEQSHSISVIDGEIDSVVKTIGIGLFPADGDINTETGRVYVGNSSIIQGDCLPRGRPQAPHPHRLWGRAVSPTTGGPPRRSSGLSSKRSPGLLSCYRGSAPTSANPEDLP